MSIDMLLACLQMPDAMGDKLTDWDKDQILSRCGEAYRLLEEQRKQINEQAAELAKLRAIVERLYHSSGPMEWLDSNCEEIAEMIYEAAEAGEET